MLESRENSSFTSKKDGMKKYQSSKTKNMDSKKEGGNFEIL